MNRLSTIPRCLVGGITGSSCRLNIAAPPVAGVVKMNAAVALDDVFVKRWPAAGGSGVLAGKLIRMISTEVGGAGARARDHDNGQKEVVKTQEDVGADDPSNDSWETFQKKLMRDVEYRPEEEIRTIFQRWSLHYQKTYASEAEKKRRFGVFKKKMRLIDSQNAMSPLRDGVILQLDAHCDLTALEFISAAKKGKL